jgi:hypothetical protein
MTYSLPLELERPPSSLGAMPPNAGSNFCSFARAWKSLVFTVFTGQLMIVEISSHE